MLAAGTARAVVAPAPLHQGSVTQTTDIGELKYNYKLMQTLD